MTLIKFKNEVPASRLGMVSFNDIVNGLFENSISADFRRWNSPAVNIIAGEEKYEIQVAAPGLSREDFKINVEGDKVLISVNKQEKEEKFTHREFRFTTFERSFTLPEDVNVDGINAAYVDGIMTVTLPKSAEVKSKVREIKIS